MISSSLLALVLGQWGQHRKGETIEWKVSPCCCGIAHRGNVQPHERAANYAVSACSTPAAHPSPSSPGRPAAARGSPAGRCPPPGGHAPVWQS